MAFVLDNYKYMNIEQGRFTVLCITNKKLVYRSSGGISHAFIPVHVDICVCVRSKPVVFDYKFHH